MTKIDDPLDQAEFQHRDKPGQGLAIGLNVAAPVISLLTEPVVGAFASVMAFGAEFLAQHRRESRAQALQQGLRDGFRDLEGRLENVEKKVVGPDAEEAITIAFRNALSSARLDKARRFGRIIGATVAEDAPNWRDAAEFIRNLEEFSDADIEALRIFWKVQRTGYRVIADGRREMSTDANDYTKTWTGVLDWANKAGVSNDDWSSRCARLSGFGLTVVVQSNAAFQGPDAMCYRLTGRAVRLLKLLGKNVDPSAYPKKLYNATGTSVTVDDEDEEKALGEGWAESPAAFKKP